MNAAGIITRVLAPTPSSIKEAARLIRDGELVVFPTETVYGLGASALNPDAVAKIFAVKGRPCDNPLIVHTTNANAALNLLSTISDCARRLAALFPAPLTLVGKKQSFIPDSVTAGLDTVAVRVPAHATALDFLEACGVPVAAPSANLSGRPSPTTATHVLSDCGGKIPLILDGGACGVGLESTVVDICGAEPRILRPGAVTAARLSEVCGVEVHYAPENSERPTSPGMKYRHYAPACPLFYSADPNAIAAKYHELSNAGLRVVVLSAGLRPNGCDCVVLGESSESAARGLFDALRRYGDSHDALIAELCADDGVGRAYNNRIRKAGKPI